MNTSEAVFCNSYFHEHWTSLHNCPGKCVLGTVQSKHGYGAPHELTACWSKQKGVTSYGGDGGNSQQVSAW
jgi:hypothetical protein